MSWWAIPVHRIYKIKGQQMMQKFVPALNFDFLTPFFDFFLSLAGYGKAFREKILKAAKVKDGENILDVGCGTGSLLILAKQKFPNIKAAGVDADEKILKIFEKKTKRIGLDIKIIKTGAEEMPFASGSFDLVVSSLVFHHLPTELKKQTMKGIHRVLKPNGRFLLADFGPSMYLKVINPILRALGIQEAWTQQDNIKGRIPEFLKEAGFQSKEVLSPHRAVRFILATKS